MALCRLVVFEFNFVNNLCRIIDEKNIIASCGLRAQEKRLLLSTWSCYIFFLSVVACWFSVAGLYMIVVDVVGLLVVDYRCRLSITFSIVGAQLCIQYAVQKRWTPKLIIYVRLVEKRLANFVRQNV